MKGTEVVRIEEVVREGQGITTLRFPFEGQASPGQFVMVWIPGVDEIPMSISYLNGLWGVTVKEVGEATKALSSLRAGERMGVRGPYGRGFDLPRGKVLCVGGGVGTAPLMPAIEAVADPSRVDVIIGARTAAEIIFKTRAERASLDVRVTTDDGSTGTKGTAVSLASAMIREKSYEVVLGCGPEIMNHFLLKACEENGVSSQLSLERLMKCGSGLCGSCVIDGRRVCVEGPVLWGNELKKMGEFGKCRRDEAGLKVRT